MQWALQSGTVVHSPSSTNQVAAIGPVPEKSYMFINYRFLCTYVACKAMFNANVNILPILILKAIKKKAMNKLVVIEEMFFTAIISKLFPLLLCNTMLFLL